MNLFNKFFCWMEGHNWMLIPGLFRTNEDGHSERICIGGCWEHQIKKDEIWIELIEEKEK